jgi:hypothetical protein
MNVYTRMCTRAAALALAVVCAHTVSLTLTFNACHDGNHYAHNTAVCCNQQIAELIGALLKTHGHTFLPSLVPQVLPVLLDMAQPPSQGALLQQLHLLCCVFYTSKSHVTLQKT